MGTSQNLLRDSLPEAASVAAWKNSKVRARNDAFPRPLHGWASKNAQGDAKAIPAGHLACSRLSIGMIQSIASQAVRWRTAVCLLALTAWLPNGQMWAQEILRAHVGVDFEDHYGDSVAALADLNADGVAEYAVGAPAFFGSTFVKVYSGIDGSELFPLTGGGLLGRSLLGIDDTNGDGIDDILSVGYDWDLTTFWMFVEVYSGADGTFLYQAPTQPYLLYADIYGAEPHALADLDGDGVDEFAVRARGIIDQSEYRYDLYVFSGATGALLWQRETESDLELTSYRDPTMAEDLDADLVPDLRVFATWEAMGGGPVEGFAFLSGADGSLVSPLVALTDRTLTQVLPPVDDWNMDGIPDPVVMGRFPSLLGFVGVISGAPTAEFLWGKALGNFPATRGQRFDWDGDGREDLLMTGFGGYTLYSGADFTRLWGLSHGVGIVGSNVSLVDDVNDDGTPEVLRLEFPPSHSGTVRVLSGAYEEICDQGALAAGVMSDARFGFSVALQANDALIGAPGENTDDGGAYVYRLGTDGFFAEVQRLASTNPGLAGQFGWDVAIEGSLAAVGAPFEAGELGAGAVRGAVYVFRRNGGVWSLEQRLQPLTLGDGAEFGYGVALSIGRPDAGTGERILVGAPGEEFMGDAEAGSVYVFDLVNGVWTESAWLHADTPSPGARFGAAVSLDGDVLAVGAPHEDGTQLRQGGAYVFDRQPSTVWTQTDHFLSPSVGADEFFGISVALQGDRLVVGESDDAFLGAQAGSAHLFTTDHVSWSLEASLLASNGQAGDRFGASVALDGNRILVGAPGSDAVAMDAGAAIAYRYDTNGNMWVEDSVRPSETGQPGELFGGAVALRGTVGLVGGIGNDGLGTFPNRGLGFFLNLSGADCNFNGVPDACDVLSGASLDCNGNRIPDECEIANLIELDCNVNGIPDACEIADGLVEDCNVNGVPDECDILDGLLTDCDNNGLADECELADGLATDYNDNGLLDVCEAVGMTYCSPNAPNSVTTTGGTLRGVGPGLVTDMETWCVAEDLPPMQFALLISSADQGQIPFPGGSSGLLCLSGSLGRHNSTVTSTGTEGVAVFPLDPQVMPTPTTPIALTAGTTYHFQAWYRDTAILGPTSNFTTGLTIDWQ